MIDLVVDKFWRKIRQICSHLSKAIVAIALFHNTMISFYSKAFLALVAIKVALLAKSTASAFLRKSKKLTTRMITTKL
jgi:hypothetical protein